MAILNNATLKQKIQDFINRVAPFTDPLIQKSEDLEVREDVVDSVQFKQANINSISSPGTNFTADYESIQQINVNTSASVPTSFVVTLDNVNTNEIVKLLITKKANDTFTFANGSIYPFNEVRDQLGKTSIVFTVFRIDTTYYAIANYNLSIDTSVINNEAVTTNKIEDSAVTTDKIDNSAVTTNKINNQAVNASKIANNSITSSKVNNTIPITKGSTSISDFNDETRSGLYYVAAGVAANRPSSNAGTLIVTDASLIVLQTFFEGTTLANANIYYRRSGNSGSTWSAWQTY